MAQPKRRVLVASNRGPVSFRFTSEGTLTAQRGGGGMIAGVMSGLAALGADTGSVWICAALGDADRAAAHRGTLPADAQDVRMLDIPPDVFDTAYNEVANSTLWFVHHMLFSTPTQPRFGAGFDHNWQSYTDYNMAFAAALTEEAQRTEGTDTSALIQDYHLALAPRMLRDLAPDVRIAHFSHTPWAPPAYYRMLPDRAARAILEGICGADHAGFLAPAWADAFLECCAEILGADVSGGPVGPADPASPVGTADPASTVSYRGHVTEVAVHPLGVDAPGLRARAAAADVERHIATLRKATEGRQLIVRVDRTELSKNVLGGLAAYRELLTTHPAWRGRVVHLAFAYPSRSALPEYRAYNEQVQRVAAEINEEFGTEAWTPLILEVKDDYARSLAACRLADVLLINPIRDGMNLVAQEGPVLSDRGCALVLSREAGAAALLGDDALLVNPFDLTQTADALHRALNMAPEERHRRSAAVAAAAADRAPARWLAEQLAALS